MEFAAGAGPRFPKPKVACSSQAGIANNFNKLLKIIHPCILFLFSKKCLPQSMKRVGRLSPVVDVSVRYRLCYGASKSLRNSEAGLTAEIKRRPRAGVQAR
jgi:hypothetical protein